MNFGCTDWVNVATEIGHGMTKGQCLGRWLKLNKNHRKPRCQATSTAVNAYLPVDPKLLYSRRVGGTSAWDTEADRYDVDVESAFNKQRRKRG